MAFRAFEVSVAEAVVAVLPFAFDGAFGLGAAGTRARVEQLRTLALYDVLSPTERGLFLYDFIVARAVGLLSGEGAAFPKIIAAALALEERGLSLSGVRLAEAPWGKLIQVLDGAVAQVDGLLVLSFEGSDVNSDEAFAGAEEYERRGPGTGRAL